MIKIEAVSMKPYILAPKRRPWVARAILAAACLGVLALVVGMVLGINLLSLIGTGVLFGSVTSAAATVGGSPFAGIDQGEKLFYVFGTITPVGNYAAGGDTFDFTKTTFGDGSQLPAGYGPVPGSVTIQSNSAANGHSGYLYFYRPAAAPTMQNGKFQVLNSNGTLMVDIGGGAYPAAVTADSIVFSAAFVRI